MSARYYYSFIHLLVLLTNMYGVQYVPGIKLDARETQMALTLLLISRNLSFNRKFWTEIKILINYI